MKSNHHRNQTWTLGDLITAVHSICGKRRAHGILRLAINAQVVVFRTQRPLVIA